MLNIIALSTDSLSYHTSCTFEAGLGSKHLYNFGPDPSFDETELNSIKFMEIVETYAIPREASRELIYLFRTVLQNNLNGAEFKNGKHHKYTGNKVLYRNLEAAKNDPNNVSNRLHVLCDFIN